MRLDVYVITVTDSSRGRTDACEVVFDEEEAKQLAGKWTDEDKGFSATYRHFKKKLPDIPFPLVKELPQLDQDLDDLIKSQAKSFAALMMIAEGINKLKKASKEG